MRCLKLSRSSEQITTTRVCSVLSIAVGRTTNCRDFAPQAVLRGLSVRFTNAGAMLDDLAGQDGPRAFGRALARPCRPRVLVVEEAGYLTYGTRHADPLFAVVTRR